MEKVLRILHFDLRTCGKSILALTSLFLVFGIYVAFSIRYLQVIPISIMIWVSMEAGFPFVLSSKSGLDNLLATFPLNRRTIIKGRYLFSILLGGIGIALSEIMICILNAFFQIRFDIKETFFTLCLSLILYVVIIALHLPLYFRYSYKQAIMVSPLFLYIIYTISLQIYYIVDVYERIRPFIDFVWTNGTIFLIGVLLLSAIILYSSYLITCTLFINKDL